MLFLALYYHKKDYRMSTKERERQVNGYREHFGIHTYTAKALHYQSQAYGKISDYQSAIQCALVSYGMYQTINGEGIETMRVLSTLGKLHIYAGNIKLGFKKLDDAKNVAENALGEHERVAQCYEQSAKLKRAHGFNNEARELELRADAIRKNFEMKSMVINMKKYSLQVSRETHLAHDFYALPSELDKGSDDYYIQAALFFMLIAIIWRMFEIYYTCNCER